MRAVGEFRIASLRKENEELKQLIIQAKKKRLEASKHAKQLAEANYYLENCLCEVYNEINSLQRENTKLAMKKQDHEKRKLYSRRENRATFVYY